MRRIENGSVERYSLLRDIYGQRNGTTAYDPERTFMIDPLRGSILQDGRISPAEPSRAYSTELAPTVAMGAGPG